MKNVIYKHAIYVNGKILFMRVSGDLIKKNETITFQDTEYYIVNTLAPIWVNNETYVVPCEAKKVKYKWFANCDDGAFEDHSKEIFNTKKECYNSMRNAVLEKMKWNTQFDEDFNDDIDTCIAYEVKFSQDRITHNSYSGLYVYEIKKSFEEEI